MKNKLVKSVLCCIFTLALLFGAIPVSAEQDARAVGEAQSFADGILAYKLKEAGASSVQGWIDGYLTENAGTTEWYALTLTQYGSYDFSAYERALLKYLSENKVSSASSRQKYALLLIGMGSGDEFIYNTLNDSIGKQGVMSLIFGLHLLNNGYESREYSLSALKQQLLSLRHSDDGWSVMGSYGDVDTTAMAIQALAPYYKTDGTVKSAVDGALSFLSKKQNDSGDFASYGVNNPESTAQVLLALSSLGIDCATDSRFIKNGNTLFDGIGIYKLADGSFCHKLGGGSNGTATVQVFYSTVAYIRMQNGKSGLYIFDKRNPSALKTPADTPTSPSEDKTSSKAEESAETAKPSNTEGSAAASETGSTASVSNTSEETAGDYSSDQGSLSDGEPQADTDSDGGKITENTDGQQAAEKPSGGGYKIWAVSIIALIAFVICGILYLKRKRNIKNFAVVTAGAVILIILVLLTNFQSADGYYGNADSEKANAVGRVTITIRCDTIEDRGAEHIPDNGVILDSTEVEIEEGDTVYDVLSEAAAANKIQLETKGGGSSAYVEGINNIYEFDFGDLSGWMYFVNGTAPSVGCGEYPLSDRDEIKWLYTCNLGKDLE